MAKSAGTVRKMEAENQQGETQLPNENGKSKYEACACTFLFVFYLFVFFSAVADLTRELFSFDRP